MRFFRTCRMIVGIAVLFWRIWVPALIAGISLGYFLALGAVIGLVCLGIILFAVVCKYPYSPEPVVFYGVICTLGLLAGLISTSLIVGTIPLPVIHPQRSWFLR
jgi:hypothetical protein